MNHFHYQPDAYEDDPDAVGYEDGDYEQDYHSDDRWAKEGIGIKSFLRKISENCFGENKMENPAETFIQSNPANVAAISLHTENNKFIFL